MFRAKGCAPYLSTGLRRWGIDMKNCSGCYWYEQCARETICDDFSPIEEDFSANIEENKRIFLEDWWEYEREYGDS